MSNISLSIFSIFILFLSYSCVFSTDKENFVVVNQDVTAPSVYNLSKSLELDTIYFWYAQQFTFDFQSSNQPIIGVNVLVNGNTLTFEGNKGDFVLDPEHFADSLIANLTIEVYTESGTGSLSDKFHQEGFVLKKNWILLIGQVKSYDPEFRYSITKDGFVKLEWNSYPWDNFLSYSIGAYYPGFVYSFLPTNYFPNIDSNCFIDSLYVGGPIEYTFSYRLENDQFHDQFYSQPTKLKIDIPAPNIYINSNKDSLTISWDKSLLDGIYSLNDTRYQYDSIHFTSDEDTSFTMVNPGHGPDISFRLYIRSKMKKPAFVNTQIIISKNWSCEKQTFHLFDDIKYHKFSNELYILGNNENIRLYDYDNLTRTLLNRIITNLRGVEYIDNKDEVAIVTDNISFYGHDKKTILKQYPLHPEVKGNTLKITDDSVAFFIYGADLTSYNYTKGEIINTSRFSDLYYYLPASVAISNNLRWFVYASYNGLCIMENAGNYSFQKRYISSEKFGGALFDPIDENLIWIGSEDKLMLFDCLKMKIVQEFNVVKGFLMNIDPFSNRLLLKSKTEKKIYIFNLNSRQVEYSSNYYNPYENRFFLLKNILYENYGDQYNLDKYLQ